MRRRLLMARGSVFVVAAACFPALAQIFKCPVGDGYAFQQAPCPGLGDSGGRLLVYANGRAAPARRVSGMYRMACLRTGCRR